LTLNPASEVVAASATPAERGILLIAYNRPAPLKNTLTSLNEAIEELSRHAPQITPRLYAALDGPRDTPDDQRATAEVQRAIRAAMPTAEIAAQSQNRGLPSLLVDSLDQIFATSGINQLICVEDDVQLAPTALLALFHAADLIEKHRGDATAAAGYVVGGTPLHRDGSLEHQLLLISRNAWSVAKPFLVQYIAKFALDGRTTPGAYGARDHAAIFRWSAELARAAGVPAPDGTSQDRMRELSWRIAGTHLYGLPFRVVRHRGLWGQHNTPWHALRTGQLFQRLDQRSWDALKRELNSTR